MFVIFIIEIAQYDYYRVQNFNDHTKKDLLNLKYAS